jgi:hypothetical protein
MFTRVYSEDAYEHDLRTKPEIMRDRTYESIKESIKLTLQNQQALIDDGADFSILVSAVQRFPNLSYFFIGLQDYGCASMSGISHIEDLFREYSMITLDHHLAVCMQVFRMARLSGVQIENFHCRDLWVVPGNHYLQFRDKTQLYSAAFSDVRHLTFEYEAWKPRNARFPPYSPLSEFKRIMLCTTSTLQSLYLDANFGFMLLEEISGDAVLPALTTLSLSRLAVDVDCMENFVAKRAPKLSKLLLVDVSFLSRSDDERFPEVKDPCFQMRYLERFGKGAALTDFSFRSGFWRDKARTPGAVMSPDGERLRTFERVFKQEIRWQDAVDLVTEEDEE